MVIIDMQNTKYASNVDFENLYVRDYFAHGQDVASFSKAALPLSITKFMRRQGIVDHLDVAGGNGLLSECLKAEGLTSYCIDIFPEADLTVDLSRPLGKKGTEFLAKTLESRSYLTTCLEFLEHIDIESAQVVLDNLCAIADRFLFVSINTRPSSDNNAFHSCILPQSTWLKLFESYGYVPLEDEIVIAPHLFDFPQTPELNLLHHWRAADPFRDTKMGEPTYILLEKKNPQRPIDISAYLDVQYRKIKRPKEFGESKVVLNIVHNQDILFFRPILHVLKAQQVMILCNTNELSKLNFSWLQGYCKRANLSLIAYQDFQTISWDIVKDGLLISISESTATPSHSAAQAVVLMHRQMGGRSILLQHGIWTEHFNRSIVFASDEIWQWGAEHKQSFERRDDSQIGNCGLRRGLTEVNKWVTAGSPKLYDIMLDQVDNVVESRFGVQKNKYIRTCLLALNTHWNKHGDSGEKTEGKINDLIDQSPDVLFIVKAHPATTISSYDHLRGENVIIVDDVILALMDIEVSRLIMSIDAMIVTMGSIIIEAAAAGKPCFVLNTDLPEPQMYRGINVGTHRELQSWIKKPRHLHDPSQILTNYADGFDSDFYKLLQNSISRDSDSGRALPPVARGDRNAQLGNDSVLTKIWRAIRPSKN